MEDARAHPAKAAEDLSQRFESQAAFVGSLTHALKGLLNGLEGGLYLLESGRLKENTQRVDAGADMLRRGLRRARTLVGNTLYYARDREIHWEELALPEVVSDCAIACRRMAEEQGAVLETNAEDGRFQADRFGVQALLANLVENATQAGGGESGGGSSRHITLSAKVAPPGVVFEVAHDGKPLDASTLAGALGPVYMPSGPDRAGLWIHAAWRIAHAHGGTLSAERTDPCGESFFARLPVGIPDERPIRPDEGNHGTA